MQEGKNTIICKSKDLWIFFFFFWMCQTQCSVQENQLTAAVCSPFSCHHSNTPRLRRNAWERKRWSKVYWLQYDSPTSFRLICSACKDMQILVNPYKTLTKGWLLTPGHKLRHMMSSCKSWLSTLLYLIDIWPLKPLQEKKKKKRNITTTLVQTWYTHNSPGKVYLLAFWSCPVLPCHPNISHTKSWTSL